MTHATMARATDVSGLSKYTKYEFQVLAFTSVGDGPKSAVKSETTMEDGEKLVLITNKFYLPVLHKLLRSPPNFHFLN